MLFRKKKTPRDAAETLLVMNPKQRGKGTLQPSPTSTKTQREKKKTVNKLNKQVRAHTHTHAHTFTHARAHAHSLILLALASPDTASLPSAPPPRTQKQRKTVFSSHMHTDTGALSNMCRRTFCRGDYIR